MSHRCGSRSAAGRTGEVGLRGGQVVHVAPGAPHRDEDQRDPHPARERDVEGRSRADRDDDRHGELRDRRAEVAAGGVEAERPALLLLREEVRDVRHRAGEVTAADAAEGSDEQQHAERRLGVGDDDAEQDGRDEQEPRRHDGPVATAEDRDHEGVGESEGRADEARQRDQPEQPRELVRVNPAPGSITTTMLHSCQMMKPRNSAKIDQRRLRWAIERPVVVPESGVLWIPAVDPPTGAVGQDDRGVVRGGSGVRGGGGAHGVVMATPVVVQRWMLRR